MTQKQIHVNDVNLLLGPVQDGGDGGQRWVLLELVEMVEIEETMKLVELVDPQEVLVLVQMVELEQVT